MPGPASRFINVDGIKTHYLEAGEGYPVVLLHSGEFGGCAEISWEYTIGAMAEHFHVLAPDWVGYGKTAKLFSFEDMWSLRIDHITRFLEAMGIKKAHFIGNSMGGTMLLATAAGPRCPWPIDRLVGIAAGGNVPDNEARKILNTYDGSIEHMRRVVKTVFVNPRIRDNESYVARRQTFARIPGAWECTAAARFRAPWYEAGSLPKKPDYRALLVPTLLITGAKDVLRDPGFGPALQSDMPGSMLHVVQNGGHCPHIDEPEEVNGVILDFLLSSA
jgi:pimeloyl-ACP methyl ester carboxylesterase